MRVIFSVIKQSGDLTPSNKVLFSRIVDAHQDVTVPYESIVQSLHYLYVSIPHMIQVTYQF